MELYHLGQDPYETVNLASDNPEKAQELLQQLRTWRKSIGAQMMKPNPDYDPDKGRQARK